MNNDNLKTFFKILIMNDQDLELDEISDDEIIVVSENKFLWETECGPCCEAMKSAWMITENGKLICLVNAL